MDIKKTALKGVKWTALSSLISSVVKLLQVAILTRFLTKEDFGIIAIAILFIGFTSIFLDMGLSTAIMHKQNISKKHYSSLFWLNVFTGMILTIMLILVAPFIASYYHDNSLKPIIQLLSLNVLFSSIGRQSRTIRHKQLNFKFMSQVVNITSVLTLIIVVALATNGFGVYSLVYSTLFNIAFSNVVYLAHGLKVDKNITLHFNLEETYSYLKIGVYQLGSAILDYFSRELDIIIISMAFGKETLGVYSLCKRIGLMLFSIITPIILNVTTPIFAKLQNSKKQLTKEFIKVFNLISIINFPIFVLFALLSPGILYYLYGENYTDYNVILSLLLIIYGISSVNVLVSSIQIALGRTDIGFFWTIYRIISNSIYLYIGVLYSHNPTVVVLSLLIGAIINILPFWIIQVKPLIGMKFSDYIKVLFYPFIIAIAIGFSLKYFINEKMGILNMIFIGVIYFIIYALFIIIKEPIIFVKLKKFLIK